VFENIAFGLRIARMPEDQVRSRIANALELVRLPGFDKRAVQTLSGGQAQRIALARAIVNRPKVLLFDEPLSSLDLQIRRELQVELKDIHRELQGTFVYVTHDQEEAMSMSDRVVVMNKGNIVQVGPPVELYRSPVSLFVAAFVGSSNIWHGEVVDADDRGTVVSVNGTRMRGAAADGVRPGDKVALVLRSEVARVAAPSRAEAPDPLTSMQGIVADVLFVGPVVNYHVEVGGRRMTISRSSHEEALVLDEGNAVTVTWNAKDVHVLRETDAIDQQLGRNSEPGRRQT
jgi:spermidine/putrescine transport system ATP-binding protein